VEQGKKEKIARTIRLDPEVDERLQAVCKRLGVTMNSFLISAVGECIVKHEAQMRIESGVVDVMREAISAMLSAASVSPEQALQLQAEIEEESKAQK